jgi:hypothetical protein
MKLYTNPSRPLANSLAGDTTATLATATASSSNENTHGYRLANTAASIDDDGWALIAPFGQHPKIRVYREGRVIKEQRFIQVLDHQSADAMLAKENSFFRTLKRALVGIPIFKEHGDLSEVDPQAVGHEGGKVKLGVIDRIRKSARGIEAHFALDTDGAAAVAAGWKLPSALWWVLPIARPAGASSNAAGPETVWCRPFKLISVALTRHPNISGVEPLANGATLCPATPAGAAKTETKPNQDIMKELLIGWLAAQGVALANDATEQTVFAAFTQEMFARSATTTALGNENETLATVTVPALQRERDDYKRQAEAAAVALGNEQAARKAGNTLAATAVVDLAIQRGRKTVAEREAVIAALENSGDFVADSQALLEGKPVVKIAGQDTQSGKALANEEAQQVQAEYQQAFNSELIATGQNPLQAHRNVMTLPKYAGLAAKLVPLKH